MCGHRYQLDTLFKLLDTQSPFEGIKTNTNLYAPPSPSNCEQYQHAFHCIIVILSQSFPTKSLTAQLSNNVKHSDEANERQAHDDDKYRRNFQSRCVISIKRESTLAASSWG